MTFQLLHSEFPYKRGKLDFLFLTVQVFYAEKGNVFFTDWALVMFE
jgi:hypothetical protein